MSNNFNYMIKKYKLLYLKNNPCFLELEMKFNYILKTNFRIKIKNY